jgi:hypothetical protein
VTRIVKLGHLHRKHIRKKTKYLINSMSKVKSKKENRFKEKIVKKNHCQPELTFHTCDPDRETRMTA